MTFNSDELLAGFAPVQNNQNPLKGLNPGQLKAAETTEGPVVVLAGAGTGKTTTMVKRTAYIIQEGKAKASEILMVTFTRKAAGEMRSRLANILGPDVAQKITVGSQTLFIR